MQVLVLALALRSFLSGILPVPETEMNIRLELKAMQGR